MSRGQNPLVLMMALSLPGAANALGLGEIHVDSALNEPLAAEIDIVGASADDLAGLTATIANKETFVRFGADRPAFLSSATFKVSQDAKGRPVLAIRSTDSFTEPLVNLVVDLRWHNGEVIRQYSLLLDPAGFPSATQVAAAIPAVKSAVSAALITQHPPQAGVAAAGEMPTVDAPVVTRKMSRVKVGAKATLRGVAWRVGARTESDLQRLQIAIFRANPSAFEGNINRLRLGAMLSIPSDAEVSSISTAEASHEIHAQMMAWRGSPLKAHATTAPALAQLAPLSNSATATNAANAETTGASSDAQTKSSGGAAEAALNQRVLSLEQGLHDIQGQLEREHDKMLGMQAQVQYVQSNANTVVKPPAVAVAGPSTLTQVAGVGLLMGAFGAMYLWLRRRAAAVGRRGGSNLIIAPFVEEAEVPKAPVPTAARESLARRDSISEAKLNASDDQPDLSAAWNSVREKQEAKIHAQISADLELSAAVKTPEPSASQVIRNNQLLDAAAAAALEESYEDTLDLSGETAILSNETINSGSDTANLPAATVNMRAADTSDDLGSEDLINEEAIRVDPTKLDYNLVDLDMTAQHVQMPSVLHENVVLKERRTNLVDVLRTAIEREPERRDLRMKLLETYYAAAATNRQGFLDVVEKLARERDRLADGEWDKIAFMGRQIAADTALFSEADTEDDELADCA
jgi:pilus assembly protein FimV